MAKKQTAQTSPGATPNQLRAWAYLGAWELVADIFAEFPGMLAQVNAAATNGHAPRGVRHYARISHADNPSVGDMVRQAPTNGHGPAPAPAKPKHARKSFTAAQRAELAERMRKQWRKAKREGKKSLRPDGKLQGAARGKA